MTLGRPLVCAALVLGLAGGCGDSSSKPEPTQAAPTTASRPAGPEQRYVGLVHRGPPRGVKDLGGALIGGVFSISRMQAGTQEMLWLERRVSPAGAARPTLRVVSVLALPARKASEVVAVADCELGTRRQSQVVAIWPTDRGTEAPARLAWLADGRARRFQPIDARQVHCPEELAG